MSSDSPIIVDTFAEAFDMRYCRVLVTAHDAYWLDAAVREVCGYGSSVIGCDAEIGVETWLDASETPDGRPGASLLVFGFSKGALSKTLPNRIGQCVMTCPTTAVFDGLCASEARIPLGKGLRYFGDGYQKSKQVEGERFWRVPVMDGEFWVVDEVGLERGIGGGNLIMQAATLESALKAARAATDAVQKIPGVMTPFPGGIARSGSKVGSRYKGLSASTADGYCPTLKGRVETKLVEGTNAALELVIDAVSTEAMNAAMSAAIEALVSEDVLAIGAGNYGGKLGKHHFRLAELTDRRVTAESGPVSG